MNNNYLSQAVPATIIYGKTKHRTNTSLPNVI